MGLAMHEDRWDGQLSMAPASAVPGNSPTIPVRARFPSEAPNPPGHRQNLGLLQVRASRVCYSGLRCCSSLSFPYYTFCYCPFLKSYNFLKEASQSNDVQAKAEVAGIPCTVNKLEFLDIKRTRQEKNSRSKSVF